MKEIHPEILIFSVCKDNKTDIENEMAVDAIKGYMDEHAIPYKPLLGCYKGIKEDSFLIPIKYESWVKKACLDFNQDCYLKSYCDRSTVLVYPKTGIITPRGQFVSVSKDTALSADAWTKDLTTGKYYVII